MAAALLTVRILSTNGRVFCVSGYASDAANVLVKFDESKIAVAGSPDSYVIKQPGVLTDVCFTSDLATPTHVQIQRNGTPTGDILDVTAQLASVNSRPNPAVPFNSGDKLGIMQLA